MNDTPVRKTMDDQTRHIAQRLEQVGYEALWANGKGGGFWINGLGYKSLKECSDLIAMMIVVKWGYVNWQPATCPGCGATLNADGTCPREIELDASLVEPVLADDDTEEIPLDGWASKEDMDAASAYQPALGDIEIAFEDALAKNDAPRTFPDEVFMPDDYMPVDGIDFDGEW